MSANYDKYAFKPITENPIVLDFSNCQYASQIHKILKDKFGLPDYYGENWDALWDCLDGLFYDREPYVVKICGLSLLSEDLRDYCETMIEVFDRVHTETPNVVFEIEKQ